MRIKIFKLKDTLNEKGLLKCAIETDVEFLLLRSSRACRCKQRGTCSSKDFKIDRLLRCRWTDGLLETEETTAQRM